jgi:hypothetical protein
MGAGQGKKHNM